MKIISLTLSGNVKLLALRHISYVAYQPNRDIQLIVGTNGSGKSALLWELSPLPADKNHYTEDGSKVVEVEHGGELYRLTSWFSPSPKHSFLRIRDNEELNPGNTLTVQKELCEKVLNYSMAIHLVMTGKERFTTMEAKTRREWITRLSPTSYDYALAEYRRVQEALRDATGSLRTAKKMLVEKEAQVTSIDTQKKLEQEIEQMHADLQIMLELRKPVDVDSQTLNAKVMDGRTRLKAISSQLLAMKIEHPYALYGEPAEAVMVRNDWGELTSVKFTSTAQVTDYIQALKVQMAQVQTRIDEASKNHEKLQKTADVLQQTGQKSRESMERDIEALRKLVQNHQDKLRFKEAMALDHVDPRLAQAALDSITETLYRLLEDFPENQDKRFSKAVKETLLATRLELREKIAAKTEVVNKLNAEISHYEHHANDRLISCPACRHQWIPNDKTQTVKELKLKVEEETDQIKTLEKSLGEQDEKIAELEAYFTQYRQYMDLTKTTPVLNPLWAYIGEKQFLIEQPKRILSILSGFSSDLQQLREIRQLGEQIAEIEKLMAAAAGVGDANLATTLADLKEIEQRIEAETQTLTQYRTWLNRYESYRKALLEAENLGSQVSTLLANLNTWQDEAIETLRREMLNHAIRQFQVSMNTKESTLASISAKRNEVNLLVSQIQEHEENVVIYKAIRDVLSPTEGLIAKGLLGFVQSLIEEMNLTISQIWTYPMTMLDCASMVDDSAELDYAFPLQVNHQARPVPDIKEASKGQQEVIDLAFKLVLMKYENLDRDILHLDEFGSSMDTAHRHAAAQAISKIIQDYGFGQIFIVSHDSHVHGALHADVNVLDAANIITPEVYNEHLELQ
jgi:ABC-type Mn2+/Zn2+ transport system ATPase subunit